MSHVFATHSFNLDPSNKTILAITLCVYVLFLLAISIFASRRVETEADYLVAGRRLPLFLAWGTLIATWFGAATMFAAAGAVREEGLLLVLAHLFWQGCFSPVHCGTRTFSLWLTSIVRHTGRQQS